MKKQRLYLFLIVVLFTACSSPIAQSAPSVRAETPASTTQSQEIQLSPIPSWTPTPYPSVIASITPSSNQTPEIMNPSIVQMCPGGENELLIDQIGLGENLRLLVYPSSQYIEGGITGGLWNVSEANPNPQVIPNTEPIPGWIYQYFIPSPSGHWIKMQSHNEDFSQTAAWVISLDGLQQWLLAEGDHTVVIPTWVSDQEMIGIGVPNPEQYEDLNWEDYIPLFSIDPFTLETRSLEPLPDKAIFEMYFTRGSESYAVYHEGLQPYELWAVYNYNDHSILPVLNWLVGREDVYFANSGITLRQDPEGNVLFYVYVRRPYGFDLAWDLSLYQIALPETYEEAMTAISIPGEFSVTTIGPWVGLSSVVVETVSGDISDGKLDRFFLLDFENMILREYCLGDERLPEIHESPDGRFLALTYASTESISWIPEEVVILNLKTGYLSRIPDVGAVGWGVAGESVSP